MKNIIIVIVFIMCVPTIGYSQEGDYLNSRFALISTNYKDESCHQCRDISIGLYNQMKNKSIFNFSDEYPNWRDAWERNDLSKYRGIDFFLTSKVEKKLLNYEVIFILYDTNKAEHHTENFTKVVKPTNFHNDIGSIADLIIQELNDFKSRGHFKGVILVDDFDIIPAADDLAAFSEDFSGWLASELSEHKIISLNYHVFYYKNFNSDVNNVLNGKFYPQDNTQLKMKMEVQLQGKKKKCGTLIIDLIEYDLNKKDILDEIHTIIEKLDPRI